MKNLLFFLRFLALLTGCSEPGADPLSELPSCSVLPAYPEYTSVEKGFPETAKAAFPFKKPMLELREI